MTIKAQKAALFNVSLAFVGSNKHDVVLLILIFIALQFVQSHSVKTEESGFVCLLLFFLTPLNSFSFVKVLSIRFTVLHSLFHIHLYWRLFCNKIKNFTDFYFILFVCLNIRLIIRRIFSDCHLCYLYQNGQLAKVFGNGHKWDWQDCSQVKLAKLFPSDNGRIIPK